jgi:hypothetical protein
LAGQAAVEPEQVSATSHSPVAARQVVPAATRASPGHAAELPVHVSATSQAPADARQTLPVHVCPQLAQLVTLQVLQVAQCWPQTAAFVIVQLAQAVQTGLQFGVGQLPYLSQPPQVPQVQLPYLSQFRQPVLVYEAQPQ